MTTSWTPLACRSAQCRCSSMVVRIQSIGGCRLGWIASNTCFLAGVSAKITFTTVQARETQRPDPPPLRCSWPHGVHAEVLRPCLSCLCDRQPREPFARREFASAVLSLCRCANRVVNVAGRPERFVRPRRVLCASDSHGRQNICEAQLLSTLGMHAAMSASSAWLCQPDSGRRKTTSPATICHVVVVYAARRSIPPGPRPRSWRETKRAVEIRPKMPAVILNQ